jgi:hypothetical protein
MAPNLWDTLYKLLQYLRSAFPDIQVGISLIVCIAVSGFRTLQSFSSSGTNYNRKLKILNEIQQMSEHLEWRTGLF